MRVSRERLLRAGLQLPRAGSWLARAAHDIGFAVQRRASRPLFEWATSGMSGGGRPSVKLVRIKERAGARSAVLWLFGEDQASPSGVVKTALNDRGAIRLAAELDNLTVIGASAAEGGAALPSAEPVVTYGLSTRFTFLTGVPADAAIAGEPGRHRIVVEQLARWLRGWHHVTRNQREIDTTWLMRELIGPAHAVRDVLDNPEPYFRWLAAACARLTGRTLGLVASHGDLTMSNVVVDGSRPLGIVDWESARPDGLPLADLYYAAADARAAAGRYKHRADTLGESFTVESEYGRFVAGQALIADPEVAREPEIAELLLHATALQHAVDEQAKGHGGQRPFAGLVRSLADRARTRR